MTAFKWLLLFLGAGIVYVVYNEMVILPYQTFDPSNLVSYDSMMNREPLINLVLVFGSFLQLVVGSWSYVSYDELIKVMDPSGSLTTTKGEVVKVSSNDVQDLIGVR